MNAPAPTTPTVAGAAGAAGLDLAPDASPEQILAAAAAHWPGRLALITAWQAEGMVLLDLASRLGLSLPVWTIDTGRLPEETHAFMAEVERHYHIRIAVAAPAPDEIAALVATRGANAFYRSALDRQLCCEIRKSRVLDRFLRGDGASDGARLAEAGSSAPGSPVPIAPKIAAWVTGLRRGQSPARRAVQPLEPDPRHPGLWRLAPLALWTAAQVEDYTRSHAVPRHPLYARGFPSIGCAPCTRATAPGESPRSGRWWWEQKGKKECGLHDATRLPEFDAALAAVLHPRTGEPLAS